MSTYTDRLMRNFAVRGDFRRDLAAATKPLTIISGADDELMFCGQICRSRARREGRGRRQGARRHQPHGYRRRAEGDIHRRRRCRHARHGGVIAASGGDGNMIDSREASEALAEINEMTRRVRQSRIYNLASLMLIMWGALVFAGYLGTVSAAAPGRLFLGRAERRGRRGIVCDQRLRISQDGHSHLRFQDADRVRAVLRLWFPLHQRARPLHAAPDGHVLADLFHAALHHRRALVRPRLCCDRSLPSAR